MRIDSVFSGNINGPGFQLAFTNPKGFLNTLKPFVCFYNPTIFFLMPAGYDCIVAVVFFFFGEGIFSDFFYKVKYSYSFAV